MCLRREGRSLTIAQMQHFRAVCQYGGVSKASEAIHVSQPSISISIKNLEEEFGVALFQRQNKHMLLTHEGAFFYGQVNKLLNDIETLFQHMVNMGKQKRRIRLCMPVFAASHLFTYLLGDFSKSNPQTHFEVTQCGFKPAIEMLDNNACDLAIVVDNGTIPDKFDKTIVFVTEFLYCVASTHRFADRTIIGMSELCDEPLILNQNESYMTTQVKKRFYSLGLVPNVLLYAVQLPLIKEMLYSDKAGTFLSKELASSLPDIVGIALDNPIALTFVLIRKKDGYMSSGIKTFINHTKEKTGN
jgi:DNA-binding transcriptional LysR family regulator